MIDRRAFIRLLGGAAAWPVGARAQQPVMPVIGLLHSTSNDAAFFGRLRTFHHGLRETGFVEGENVQIVYRFAEDQIDRLPALAADLERFPKRLSLGFSHRSESDSSFLLEEASMDGEAVFGGLANARGRDD